MKVKRFWADPWPYIRYGGTPYRRTVVGIAHEYEMVSLWWPVQGDTDGYEATLVISELMKVSKQCVPMTEAIARLRMLGFDAQLPEFPSQRELANRYLK